MIPTNEIDTNTWYVRYAFILAGLIMTVYAMIIAKSILQPLFFAVFFSILLSPLCNFMERYKVPRVLSVLIAIIIGVLFLVAVISFFYTQVIDFSQDIDIFRDRFEELLIATQEYLNKQFGYEGILDLTLVRESVTSFFTNNSNSLVSGLANAASAFTAIFLVPVLMFFLLLFRGFLKEFLLKLFGRGSDEYTEKVSTIINNIQTVIQKYITGVIIVITILGTLYSTMLWFIGIDHPLFFGVFAAVLNVIPFIGPLLGSVLPILYSIFTMDSLLYPIIIFAGFYVVQMIEGNLLTPLIVGSQVSLNAFVALLLLFVGAQIWGLVGMILIIPIGAILKVIFDEVESLEPYGFLMGRVPDEEDLQSNRLGKKIRQLSGDDTEQGSDSHQT
ncbi:MAG: AI-2E family transporter [Bacteroidetes bacterium]|jgi:predicted PurR-regulated permease PerM|nr:AI-2E family transporter [Bacteroidota bacterium]PTM15739.1 MAG: AI-2E family transporter [Bacteroidota bacterium]PTM20844.1 MAG: AI-2E family transporter [Bacteroidota bacterium]